MLIISGGRHQNIIQVNETKVKISYHGVLLYLPNSQKICNAGELDLCSMWQSVGNYAIFSKYVLNVESVLVDGVYVPKLAKGRFVGVLSWLERFAFDAISEVFYCEIRG